jgi:hypothetical protein
VLPSPGRLRPVAAIPLAATPAAVLVAAVLGSLGSDPLLAEVRWSARNRAELRGDRFFESSPREDRDSHLDADLTFELVGQLSPRLSFTVTPRISIDAADRAGSAVRLLEDGLQRPGLGLAEAFLRYYGQKWELSAGKQVLTWGVADGFRPTDVASPRDFLSVADSFKLGVPALNAYRTGSKLNLQLLAVPHFSPHRLPLPDNRWARPPEGADVYRETFGLEPVIDDLDRELPSTTLDDVQLGLRLSSSTLATGWDLALSFFRGFDPYGVFRVALEAPPLVDLTYVYPEYRQVGGSFSTVRGRFELHGEAALHDTVRNELEDDYLQYVAGTNVTLLPKGLDQLVLTFEYAGESVLDERPDTTSFTRTGFSRPFVSSLFVNSIWLVSEDLRVEAGAVRNLDTGDWSARLLGSRRLVEGLTLAAGIDVFEGDPLTFFGAWERNDRLFVHLAYSY